MELKFWCVKSFLCIMGFFSLGAIAQTGSDASSVGLSDLPSATAKPKLPGVGESANSPDLPGFTPAESSSIPKPRPPAPDPVLPKDKNDSDWIVQDMEKKKEDAKKRAQEQVALEEKKAKETQAELDKEKKEKEARTKSSDQPVISKASVSGVGEADAKKLPVVTGLDGVKPRAMASGDGRVQPGFDSFTGPSSTGPLGKDYQSGAKPIMAGNSMSDGRIQVPPKPLEVPSGAYKRISQDPNSLPPGYGEKKSAVAPPPKPVSIPSNPSSGDPKRVVDNSKAGFSPYDNTKSVPDPRSQRRF